MSGCQCKSGFFFLRDCDNPVAGQCSTCQRAMCARHMAIDSGGTQCLDCRARDGQQTNTAYDPDHEDQWAHSYRHRYYSAGYAPIYTGSSRDRYYDSYDTRSFAQTQGGDELDATDSHAGFGDS